MYEQAKKAQFLNELFQLIKMSMMLFPVIASTASTIDRRREYVDSTRQSVEQYLACLEEISQWHHAALPEVQFDPTQPDIDFHNIDEGTSLTHSILP